MTSKVLSCTVGPPSQSKCGPYRDSVQLPSSTRRSRATLEALQAAYEQSTATMKGRMEELTGGLNLNLPGMGG